MRNGIWLDRGPQYLDPFPRCMAICESVPDIFFTQEPVTTNGAQENMPVTGFPLRPPHRCKPGEGYGRTPHAREWWAGIGDRTGQSPPAGQHHRDWSWEGESPALSGVISLRRFRHDHQVNRAWVYIAKMVRVRGWNREVQLKRSQNLSKSPGGLKIPIHHMREYRFSRILAAPNCSRRASLSGIPEITTTYEMAPVVEQHGPWGRPCKFFWGSWL